MGAVSFVAVLETHTILWELFVQHQEALLDLDLPHALERLEEFEHRLQHHIWEEEAGIESLLSHPRSGDDGDGAARDPDPLRSRVVRGTTHASGSVVDLRGPLAQRDQSAPPSPRACKGEPGRFGAFQADPSARRHAATLDVPYVWD